MQLASVLPSFLRRPQPTAEPQSQLPIALVGYSRAGKTYLACGLLQELHTARGVLSLALRSRKGTPPWVKVSLDGGATWVPPENYPPFMGIYQSFGRMPSTNRQAGGVAQGGPGQLGIRIGVGEREADLFLWDTVGQTPETVLQAGAYVMTIRARDLDPSRQGTFYDTFDVWADLIGRRLTAPEGRRIPLALVITAVDEVGPGSRLYQALRPEFFHAWHQFAGLRASADPGAIYKAAAMMRWAQPRVWNLLLGIKQIGHSLRLLAIQRPSPPIFLTSAVNTIPADMIWLAEMHWLEELGETQALQKLRSTPPTAEILEAGPQPILASAPFLYLLTKMRPREFNFGNW